MDPGGEARNGCGKGANETMNVWIPHKVLDYWRQLKQEYIQEKRVGHLATTGPRTSWANLDSC
jgi:hypothetical protein